MSGLATRLDQLTPEKRALFDKLMRERRTAQAADAIPRRTGDGELPLGFAQERLWFLEQMEPGNPVYNVPLALALRGRLDTSALEAGLREIVARHESLRAVFSAEGGRPVQRVLAEVELTLERRDVGGPARAKSALRRGGSPAPFDLARVRSCARSCSAGAKTSTCWSSPSTTSPATDGRWEC